MNLPNKITLARIFLTVIIIIIMLFPFESAGLEFSKLFINESLVVDTKYFLIGILFAIASISDLIDGRIARKRGLVTDLGKMLDAIADKILVNSVLIILAATGFISVIIPVVIIFRDTVVDTIKMVAGSKGNVVAASNLGKFKTIFMMVGLTLTLFYNLPFELLNIKVADVILIIACILSVISGIDYYNKNKKYIFE